jgi:hypothetical protein
MIPMVMIMPKTIATTTGELTEICLNAFKIITTTHDTFAIFVNYIIIETGKNVIIV